MNPAETPLAHSPRTPTEEARTAVLRPKSLAERARLNAGSVSEYAFIVDSILYFMIKNDI